MNQEYRERVKRHLASGGDPKYVNVKKKAQARHNSEAIKNKKGLKENRHSTPEPKHKDSFAKHIDDMKEKGLRYL